MSGAREAILARIGRDTPPATAAVAALGSTPCDWAQRAQRFAACATAASATVATADSPQAAAAGIADYLERQGLPPRVHVSAATPALDGLATETRLQLATGGLPDDGATVVTGCLAALAGEGVVVLATGPGHAAESVFLSATHIVVVSPGQLLDSLDALWGLVRTLPAPLPRMVNLILGPSRTADLGVPSRLGAHGPLRVHVVLVAPVEAT